MALPQARFQPASDQSLLVVLGNEISLKTHRRVAALLHELQQQPIPGIVNLHPAYCSLLIVFDALALRHSELEQTLRSYLDRADDVAQPEPRRIEIPVCYDAEFGLDLQEVAAACSLPVEAVIEMHCANDYLAYFLGFVPGFAYLGDLPEPLIVPRLDSPRRQVPRGSVAIAGRQTGIYPLATPGGWRILGRTPLAMFRPDRERPSLLSPGDRVRFHPISRHQFSALERP